MSQLKFASLGDAFILGSQQIKDTQDEIARLKALVLETSGMGPTKPEQSGKPEPKKSEYTRVGQPDTTKATFVPKTNDINDLIEKVIEHPKFKDIVKNAVNYREYTLQSTQYAPAQPPVQVPVPRQVPQKESFTTKESFGELSVCTLNTIIFLLISLFIYIVFHNFN